MTYQKKIKGFYSKQNKNILREKRNKVLFLYVNIKKYTTQ